MKFEREYYVGIKDVGLNNKMSNYGILSCLEEIASSHSDKVGYGEIGRASCRERV